MFVSYAQNFEDVILWRALGHVQNGFYVDVGAQDPLTDSVSLAFYERGLRGIHVEPNAHYAQRLRESRPDEVVIQAAAGDETGSITFFEIPNTGLSTADRRIADQHAGREIQARQVTVPSMTLDEIFARCPGSVHWLKIDAEGFEGRILDGWRDSAVRPWRLLWKARCRS